jgi:RNA polymerase sigma-70 factor (ECF subfamily)
MTITRETTSPDLGTLLAQVASGNNRAFSDVYRDAAPTVLGLITRVLRDRAQAEEVTQEVFVQLWQTAARFDGAKGTAMGWILTVAHRRAIDRVRASQSAKDRDLRIGVRDHVPAYDSVAESVEISISDGDVRRAMERLTPVQRQAITLTYYGGLSVTEAAAELSVPVGTLKTRLRDGMIRLRDEMGVTSAAA